MKHYSIVYSSHTGNTAILAQKIRTALPQELCDYFGEPDDRALESPVLFVGFWTDKGTCCQEIGEFLKKLRGKQVFLFGTAGFGENDAYFRQILSRVQSLLPEDSRLAGSFMCQGKMPMAVRNRYESMLSSDPERMKHMIENFDRALFHPNSSDLDQLEEAVLAPGLLQDSPEA